MELSSNYVEFIHGADKKVLDAELSSLRESLQVSNDALEEDRTFFRRLGPWREYSLEKSKKIQQEIMSKISFVQQVVSNLIS